MCAFVFNTGIISTFLHVHPFGANIEYLWSYMQQLDSRVKKFNQNLFSLLKYCIILYCRLNSSCISIRKIMGYGAWGFAVFIHLQITIHLLLLRSYALLWLAILRGKEEQSFKWQRLAADFMILILKYSWRERKQNKRQM